MRFDLSPQAQRDLVALIDFYRHRGTRMTERLAEGYERLIDRLEEFPASAPLVRGDVRRASIPGLPLSMFYVLRPERGIVLRILHDRRSPDEWPGAR